MSPEMDSLSQDELNVLQDLNYIFVVLCIACAAGLWSLLFQEYQK